MDDYEAPKILSDSLSEALQELRNNVSFTAIHEIHSLSSIQNSILDSILEITKPVDNLKIQEIISGLQNSIDVTSIISNFNVSEFTSIIDALPKFDFISEIVDDHFLAEYAQGLYDSGKITQEDINFEISEIVNNKQFSPKTEWDKFKKSKWFIAIRILITIILLLCTPVGDYVKDKALDKFGITEFWKDSGVYDWIDTLFGEKEEESMTESEAKATVDKSKTGNISKQKREDLLNKIKEIRTFISAAPQDENTGNLLSYLSDLEKDVNGKKYGLVFEEHREEIDEVLDTHTPVLTENKDLFIDNGGQMNFLIEGDNLASLKLLEKTHKGKIDLIYIDPPYNTKNKDFIYDDSFVDNIDTFRHSKWVSFMMPRLKNAKSLLKASGVVFISIDDNEQAALKLICDEIFGERNFVSQLVWEKKKKGSFLSNSITNIKEYVLVYAKEITSFKGLIGQVNTNTETYPCINAINKREIRYIPKGIKSNYKESNYFLPAGTEISDTTMSIVLHSDLRIENGYLADELVIEGNWRYSQEAMYEYALKGEIYITRDLYLRRIVSQARYKMMKDLLPRVGDDTNLTYNSPVNENDLFASGWGSNEDADEELRLIMGKQKIFDYPKPTRLLVKLLAATRNKDAICLDFFAGSGTTGHAVMKLNAEDGGNRKFILCTNNENNICRDVTYERIKRVIDKENYSASLKYYKVDYVPISDRLYYEYADELLKHIRELVELENGINFTGNAEIAIVLTEEELESFIENVADFSKCKKLYMGHDLLPTGEQEETLKNNGIEISIIPDYYYRDLQEM